MENNYEDMSNQELIIMRDELINQVQHYEKENGQQLLQYQFALRKLAYICEILSNRIEIKHEEVTNTHYIFRIRDYLNGKGIRYDETMKQKIKSREDGHKFTLQEHIKGMIYAMLSNQTKWKHIEEHLKEINKIFFDYDSTLLKHCDCDRLATSLFELKCGNISTKRQIYAIPYNIQQMEMIEKEFGDMDAFVIFDAPEQIVRKLSSNTSKYKLKMMGEALVWEYLRNVGIDGAKPDVHLKRFFSGERMGKENHSPASNEEVIHDIKQLSKKTGLTMVEIDNYIWSYCADGYGSICTAQPHCHLCCIQECCRYRYK